MRFFRLDSSLRVKDSVSRTLADVVEREWLREHPGAEVIRRDLLTDPVPQVWPAAVSALMSPPEHVRTEEELAARAVAGSLVDELLNADAYIFAVPIYNYGVPAPVKHWIDMVITDPRATPAAPFLKGRPAVLVEARGGGYAPGTPREGWDHATPYLRRILSDVWGLDLATAEAELTLAGVNPAMEHLRDLARQQLQEAHSTAATHGIEIARRLRTAA